MTLSKIQTIAHVRYIKILTCLRGFIANFLRLHRLAIPRGDLRTKKTKPKMTRTPRGHVRILIYRTWAIIDSSEFYFHEVLEQPRT